MPVEHPAAPGRERRALDRPVAQGATASSRAAAPSSASLTGGPSLSPGKGLGDQQLPLNPTAPRSSQEGCRPAPWGRPTSGRFILEAAGGGFRGIREVRQAPTRPCGPGRCWGHGGGEVGIWTRRTPQDHVGADPPGPYLLKGAKKKKNAGARRWPPTVAQQDGELLVLAHDLENWRPGRPRSAVGRAAVCSRR